MSPIPQSLSDLPYAERLEPHDGRWTPGDDHDTVRFSAAHVEDPDGSGSSFLDCAFTGVTFDGGRLRRARFVDAWAQEMRLVGTDLSESSWQDCALLGSIAAGVNLSAAHLTRVVFRGCKLDAVNFRFCGLTDVRFEDCLLREVDFGGATLTRTSFPGSRLTRTILAGATLDRVDLRGAELGLTIDPRSMRGAVISPAQLLDLAPLLAETLGIDVAEPDGE